MNFRNLVTATVLGAAAMVPLTEAHAQALCGPRDVLIEKLRKDYGERQTAMGLRGPSGLIEIWASEKGTWTVLLTRADGLTCPVAAGTDWRTIDGAELVLGDPA